MTHGKIIQFRKGAASKCRLSLTQRTPVLRSGREDLDLRIRYFSAPGLSLLAQSRWHGRTSTDTRFKDRLYGQAIPKSNPVPAALCKIYGADIKRNRHSGPGSLSLRWSGAWLGKVNLLEKFSWNTALTGYQTKKLSRPTDFLSPIKRGPRIRSIRT